jgi:hypothetical protein
MKSLNHVLRERTDRRSIFKIAGGLLLASVFDLHSPVTGRAEMTRMRWIEQGVFPDSGSYRSAVLSAEQPFNSVELGWSATVPDGSQLEFSVRSSKDGNSWTDWWHMHADSHVDSRANGRVYAVPFLCEPSNYVQYHINIVSGATGTHPAIHEVEIGCVDTSPPARFLSQAEFDYLSSWVISRAGWGANESLRYEDGEEIWHPRYRPVEKIIVHHTATQSGGSNPAEMVRAIYYYHAVTLGWGDIGYNFLVDWQGNAYEGRAGGPEVVGAHTLSYNHGSMGIAIIGNFDDQNAAQAALDTVVRLIREQAPHVDATKASPFHDKPLVADLCGHRDFNDPDCPGTYVQRRLPDIRGWVAGTGPISDFTPPGPTNAELVNVSMAPATIYSGSTVRVDFTVRNNGNRPMYTQGPSPQHIYREGEDFVDAEPNRFEGMYRVGVNFSGNDGLPNPWRWGLPGQLNPGETTTVTGLIRLDSIREWELTASLVCELVRYERDGAFPHRVRTIPPPTQPVGADPSMHYFDVTRHNVPDVFYQYWLRNGGLRRFGYPLTEAVMEVSETDGETYLTQYFERARFEHHPQHAGTPYEVLLGLLGSERTAHRTNELPFRPVLAPPDSNHIDYFPETGHTLRSGFRDFWWDNGGLSIFGFPISEEFEEQSQTDGNVYIVQYFERNRFEWHPEFVCTEY